MILFIFPAHIPPKHLHVFCEFFNRHVLPDFFTAKYPKKVFCHKKLVFIPVNLKSADFYAGHPQDLCKLPGRLKDIWAQLFKRPSQFIQFFYPGSSQRNGFARIAVFDIRCQADDRPRDQNTDHQHSYDAGNKQCCHYNHKCLVKFVGKWEQLIRGNNTDQRPFLICKRCIRVIKIDIVDIAAKQICIRSSDGESIVIVFWCNQIDCFALLHIHIVSRPADHDILKLISFSSVLYAEYVSTVLILAEFIEWDQFL